MKRILLAMIFAGGLAAGNGSMARAGEAETPRVAPLPYEQWPEKMKATLGKSRETVLSRGGPANMPATFARHPELFDAWSGFMNTLVYNGTLPGRVRELIIMRTAWLGQSPMVWVTHTGPAPEVGITKTEVDQVIVGPSDARWSTADRAMLEAVDEFFKTGDMDDGTWKALRAQYDEKQIMELMMLISNYHMVGQMVRTMRVDFGKDFPGLRQR